jgi:hypothetical protein
MSYAAQTSVPVERSRAEIERVLQNYGAQQFIYGWDQHAAVVGFTVMHDEERRQIRFRVEVPDQASFLRSKGGQRRTAIQAEKAFQQAQRQRWRALLLVIKAKLEAIEAGIATFEDEFLAYTMLPGGETVGEWMKPQLDEVYRDGVMPKTLQLALPSGEKS